jgi:hypothetical protein
MKIIILESCFAKDRELIAGKVYDLPDNDARLLVAIRRASYFVDAPVTSAPREKTINNAK